MSNSGSQKISMAKHHRDLGGSWFNGPEEIETNWVIVDMELKLPDDKDEERKEQPANESGTEPLVPKKKRKCAKDEKKKSKKLRRYPGANPSDLPATSLMDMAISFFQKAIGGMGNGQPDYGMERVGASPGE